MNLTSLDLSIEIAALPDGKFLVKSHYSMGAGTGGGGGGGPIVMNNRDELQAWLASLANLATR